MYSLPPGSLMGLLLLPPRRHLRRETGRVPVGRRCLRGIATGGALRRFLREPMTGTMRLQMPLSPLSRVGTTGRAVLLGGCRYRRDAESRRDGNARLRPVTFRVPDP